MLTSLAHLTVWALVTASPPPGPDAPAEQTPPEFLPVSLLDWDRPLQFPGPLLLWAPLPLELLPDGRADADPAQPAPRNWGWRWVPPTPLSDLFAIIDPFRLEPFTDPREFDGKTSAQLQGPWGSLKGKLEVESAARDLNGRSAENWQAEQALQVPVAGPLYVFGKVNYGYNTWTAQQMTLSGRSGVGCKLRPVQGGEIVLTGGSLLNHQADPLQPNRLAQEKSQLVLELQARYSLLGALKLEYQGAAMPALDPLDHNRVQQDVHFALPLGQGGDLQLGAKHQWEGVTGPPRPWTDGMQLYLGVGLKR
jgi:hypothetical protein